MRSPITGKEMKLHVRKDTLDFRKEKFEILYHYYLCEDTGEIFTDEELDTKNVNQVYNQYREKYHIPYPDAIKEIRSQYGIPATKMSEVLGFGVNIYRQYEAGEVPSVSNARLIQLIQDPEEFKKLVQVSKVFDGRQYEALMEKIESLIKEKCTFKFSGLPSYLMHGFDVDGVGIYTGYKTPSLTKLIEMIVYFAEKIKPWKTKLNKLLFYADFLHFKRTCFSISGAEYVAIPLGPVPNNFSSIFDYAAINQDIVITYQEFSNGGIGEFFNSNAHRTFNRKLFEDSEIKVLEYIVEKFRDAKTNEIVALSHEELAWLENHSEKKKIKYDYAFLLKNVN